MPIGRLVCGSLIPALVLGCGDARTDRPPLATADTPRTTLLYECEGGLEFVAEIRGDTAWVLLSTGTVPLPRVATDSGGTYGAEGTVLRRAGEEAVLETPGGGARKCHNNRLRAIWEHAKLGGADFRAIGNEPGWNLEIAPDSIRLATDYGTDSVAFPTPAPQENRTARRTTYLARVGDDSVRVELMGERCRDTMSGEQFETTVTLTLGERILRGCGRALH